MPTPTYVSLATITLASATTSLSFSSIPATYRDLVLVYNGSKADTVYGHLLVRANADSALNYPRVVMGSQGSAYSNSSTALAGMQIGDMNGQRQIMSILQIMDYSATDKHKTFLVRESEAAEEVVAIAGRWTNTAAITSLTILWSQSADNMSIGSTISLYGILA